MNKPLEAALRGLLEDFELLNKRLSLEKLVDRAILKAQGEKVDVKESSKLTFLDMMSRASRFGQFITPSGARIARRAEKRAALGKTEKMTESKSRSDNA
jgi:hypothetical protein